MNDLGAIWDELVADTQAPEGVVAKRIPGRGGCGLLLAVEKPSGRRFIFVEVDAAILPGISPPPDADGYSMDLQPLPTTPPRTRLIFSPTNDAFSDLFVTVASDILGSLHGDDQAKAIDALFERLHRWQLFFEKGGVEGLSDEARRGLYAELWFLQKHLLPVLTPSAAIASWRGPLAANHDFQLGTLSVEIKSSIANPSVQIRISNVRQLEQDGVTPLYLHVVQLAVGANGNQTLPEIVADIRDEIGGQEPLAVFAFIQSLFEAGYINEHQTLYDAIRFSVRDEMTFKVEEGFPRIIEKDLRNGVGGVRYSIDLSACERFRCPNSTIHDSLRGVTDAP